VMMTGMTCGGMKMSDALLVIILCVCAIAVALAMGWRKP